METSYTFFGYFGTYQCLVFANPSFIPVHRSFAMVGSISQVDPLLICSNLAFSPQYLPKSAGNLSSKKKVSCCFATLQD